MFDVLFDALRDDRGNDAVPHPMLIEASAGTGKTWTLSHLATRFLLEEDLAPSSLLMVTFTIEAAQSLRGRVRGHLMMVLGFLEESLRPDFEVGLSPQERDEKRKNQPEWQSAYLAHSESTRANFLERGRRHLSTLDDLRAQTFHSFAADYASTSLGTIGSGKEQFDQAFHEIVAEESLANPTAFGELLDVATNQTSRLEMIRQIAKKVFGAGYRPGVGENDTVTLLPTPVAEPDDVLRLALYQRDIVLKILTRQSELLAHDGISTFSDLIANFSNRLQGEEGASLRHELRGHFRVVMIDEFQDTDPLQWGIFESIFLDAPDTRLIAVGDPKQAIYSFRSASVETFLSVKELCQRRGHDVVSLRSNRRSSLKVLDGLNAIFRGTDFHYEVAETPRSPKIAYVPVSAPPNTADSDHHLVLPGVGDYPVHLRVGAAVREDVLREVVDYVRLLRDRGRPLSSIAIISYNNRSSDEMHRWLSKAGIASVTSSDASVLESPAALHVHTLLKALAQPERSSLTNALVATWFASSVHSPDGSSRIPQVVADFRRFGVSAVVRFLRSVGVLAHVVALRDGERHVTDLLHISELLSQECTGMKSLELVAEWFAEASRQFDEGEGRDVRRLPSEGEAVRLMTIHAAKGLEFSTVLVPFLSANFGPPTIDDKFTLRTWLTSNEVVIDTGSGIEWTASGWSPEERQLRTLVAIQGEYRRVAYVALTRAVDHLVVWSNTQTKVPLKGEFIRILFDRESLAGRGAGSAVVNRSLRDVMRIFVGGGREAKDTIEKAMKGKEVALLQSFLSDVPGIHVAQIGGGHVLAQWIDETERQGDAEAEGENDDADDTISVHTRVAPTVPFQRRRWSYSSVADELKKAPETAGASDGELVGGVDERRQTTFDVRRPVAKTVQSVFGALAGAQLGIAVHAMLDQLAGRNAPELDAIATECLRKSGYRDDEIRENLGVIVSSLAAISKRPLHGVLEGVALDSIQRERSASEMRFTLALGESIRFDRLAALAEAFAQFDESGDQGRGLFHEYFAQRRWEQAGLDQGFLVGSLDLVTQRVDDAFVIVDYKTDQIGGSERPFAASAMHEVMAKEHYPLQAALYSIALHRFLEGAMDGYQPKKHLGGCGYYFVRVVGDDGAAPHDGFLSWPVSPKAIVEASMALGAS